MGVAAGVANFLPEWMRPVMQLHAIVLLAFAVAIAVLIAWALFSVRRQARVALDPMAEDSDDCEEAQGLTRGVQSPSVAPSGRSGEKSSRKNVHKQDGLV